MRNAARHRENTAPKRRCASVDFGCARFGYPSKIFQSLSRSGAILSLRVTRPVSCSVLNCSSSLTCCLTTELRGMTEGGEARFSCVPLEPLPEERSRRRERSHNLFIQAPALFVMRETQFYVARHLHTRVTCMFVVAIEHKVETVIAIRHARRICEGGRWIILADIGYRYFRLNECALALYQGTIDQHFVQTYCIR